MTQFVISIAGNALGHVTIKVAQRCNIGWIPSLDPAQLVLLSPQVCFDQLDGCRKSQERGVPFRKLSSAVARRLRTAFPTQNDTRRQGSTSDSDAFQKRTPLYYTLPMVLNIFIV